MKLLSSVFLLLLAQAQQPLPETLVFDHGTVTAAGGIITVSGFSSISFKNTGALYHVGADGKISLTFPLGPVTGRGLMGVYPSGNQTVVSSPVWSVDTAYIGYWTAPPAGPGNCVDGISGQAVGTGAMAKSNDSTGTFLYTCVVDGNGGFVWARFPMQLAW